MMEELTTYRGNPQDSSVAIAFQNATLAWDTFSLQEEKTNIERLQNMILLFSMVV